MITCKLLPFERFYFCFLIFLIFILPQNGLSQNLSLIEGRITDQNGEPVSYASISITGTAIGTAADYNGFYRLIVSPSDSIIVNFSAVGFSPFEKVVSVKRGEKVSVDVQLEIALSEIEGVLVQATQKRFGNIERISHKDFEFIPDASGSFEAILKSLPGVSSSNEMSSQYSVRGGNFDENLVYVNDIEVYRPFLVRSGQQEGLSFINSDMVEGVEFSAGGFNAEYGDKMSSVLSIRYRQPSSNTARTELSLLGANGLIEGISSNGRFTHLTGVRYKTSRYLLNSLDVSGDYTPTFIDFQSNLAYNFSPEFQLSFLGNFSSNRYLFAPDVRETRFGSFTNALQLKVFYEGKEVNSFETAQGALTAEYRPVEGLNLKILAGSYIARESETFDIIGQYLLNELDNTLGSTTYGDSLINVGVGGFINHARNYLDANFYRIEHLGNFSNDYLNFKWGFRYQIEDISDQIREWDLIDSSGYSVPRTNELLQLSYFLKSKHHTSSTKLSGFFQNSYKFNLNDWDLVTTAGIRMVYWDFNQEICVSPRASIMAKPEWNRNLAFHLSGGYYHQPPIYKEYRKVDGTINPNIKSQVSIHAVFGVEYLFTKWQRPFRLQAEVYNKQLYNLIPYKVDNVRIKYSGENLASGYVRGIDLKVNGEFVEGAESWVSISLMKAEEDIKNDSYVDENGKVIYPDYYPRPTDQRFSIGAFFQDYMPGNPTFRVHLTGFFGTGLPFSNPSSPRYDLIARMPAYKRVDIGFTKVFKDEKGKGGNYLNNILWLKGFWVGAEVFNLFDFTNTVSYLWVQTVSNQSNISGKYAVPNYLTSRRINVKIAARF